MLNVSLSHPYSSVSFAWRLERTVQSPEPSIQYLTYWTCWSQRRRPPEGYENSLARVPGWERALNMLTSCQCSHRSGACPEYLKMRSAPLPFSMSNPMCFIACKQVNADQMQSRKCTYQHELLPLALLPVCLFNPEDRSEYLRL